MRKLILPLMIGSATLAVPAGAAEPWTPEEILGETATLSLLARDYDQTLNLKDFPRLGESNPILGRHPNDKAIKTYFTVAGLIQLVYTDTLGHSGRAFFMGGVGSLELAITLHNRRLEQWAPMPQSQSTAHPKRELTLRFSF